MGMPRRRQPPRRSQRRPARGGVSLRWLAAVAVVALLGTGGLIALSSATSPSAPSKTPDELAQGSSLGSPQAKVTLEVFSDFL